MFFNQFLLLSVSFLKHDIYSLIHETSFQNNQISS